MKKISSLLTMLTAGLLVAQEAKKATPAKVQHPAVTTLIAWAESHQKGSKKEKVEIFSTEDKKALRTLGGAEDVEGEMMAFVLSKKAKLSFKAKPENPAAGMIFIEDRRFLPVKQEGKKWKGDLIAMMEGIKTSAMISTAEHDIVTFKSLLEMYRNIGGTYPSEKQGLSSLLRKPTTSPRPRRWVQTLDKEEALIDPWGNAYQYKLVEGKPVITSLGPDGKVSDDDVSNE
jgi:general secretion pathway protein G